MSPRGNPYPHRYKYGKIKNPVDLDKFTILLSRVPLVDLEGYPVEMVQAAHALFFWTGFRRSEVLGRAQIHYLVDCPNCLPKGKKGFVSANCLRCHGSGKVEAIGKPHRGLVKEDMKFEDRFLLVYSIGEQVLKHGRREAPVWLHESLPFVPLIIEQWHRTQAHQKVFPIAHVAFWNICKRMDPRFTTHFYRHNRVTDLASDEKMSLVDVCAQTGLTPETVSACMMRSGRFTRNVGDRMMQKYGVQAQSSEAVEEAKVA